MEQKYAELEEKYSKIKAELSSTNDDLKRTLIDHDKSIESFKKNMNMLRTEKEHYIEEYNKLSQWAQTAQSQLLERENQIKSGRSEQSAAATEAKDLYDHLQQNYTKCINRNKELEDIIERLRAEFNQKDKELSKVNTNFEALHKDYTIVIADYEKLSSSSKTDRDAMRKNYEKSGIEKQKMIDSIAAELEKFSEKLQSSEKRRAALEAHVESLQNIIGGHQSSIDTKTNLVLRLEDEIKNLKIENKNFEEKLEFNNSQLSSASENLNKIRESEKIEHQNNKTLAEHIRQKEGRLNMTHYDSF